ncbi:hypothetical protein Btru_009910 [Bulinus truncatus]|nr:hypothetical protein Btru_009910 [Bulinus truncatus]
MMSDFLKVSFSTYIEKNLTRRSVVTMGCLRALVLILVLQGVLGSFTIPPESEQCQRCGCNTDCVNDVCFCKEGYTGNPYFMCYSTNDSFCSIRNDPQVDIFSTQHFSEKLLGDVLAADVVTDRAAEGEGKCRTKVWTFLNRIEGKLYVTEFQVELVQETSNGTQHTFAAKVVGYVKEEPSANGIDSVYIFDVYYLREDTFEFWFQARSDTPLLLRRFVGSQFCEFDFIRVRPNMFKIDVSCCGIIIGLRPFNPNPPVIMPGFFINVDGESNPTFPVYPQAPPLCLYDQTVSVSAITGFPHVVDSLVYLALINSNVTPPFKETPSNLAALRSTLQACSTPDRLKFIQLFQTVLAKGRLVKAVCGDVPGLYELVNLLNQLLLDICGVDVEGCSRARDIIVDRFGEGEDGFLDQYCQP